MILHIVLVCPDDRNLLDMRCKGRFYMDTCNPLGLRLALTPPSPLPPTSSIVDFAE